MASLAGCGPRATYAFVSERRAPACEGRREDVVNITVYLGANAGNDPSLAAAVRELGAWIGTSGNSLVYGGSRAGLMGELADAALAAGAEVTGVEPKEFIERDLQHGGITRLIVTRDIPERRAKMIELGDAFIAFPGGTGTLEEIAEIISGVCLDHIEQPCLLYNLGGFYDELEALLAKMVRLGLSTTERQRGIHFAATLDELVGYLN